MGLYLSFEDAELVKEIAFDQTLLINIKECFVRFSNETFDEEILVLVQNLKKLKK